MGPPTTSGPRLLLKDEGGVLAYIASLNFTGAGVTASNVGIDGRADIPGGGSGGMATPKVGVVPATLSATTYQLPETPVSGSDRVFVNGAALRRVGAAPGLGEYTIAGDTITLGFALVAGDRIWADYFVTVSGSTPVIAEVPPETTGTTFTLLNVPVANTDAVYVNGARLRRVGAAPLMGEYTIAGNTITTGFALVVGDRIWVDYYF